MYFNLIGDFEYTNNHHYKGIFMSILLYLKSFVGWQVNLYTSPYKPTKI